MNTAPGVYENVDFWDYRSWDADFSASELKALSTCDNLAEFKYDRDHPKPHDSKFMANGRAVDSLISSLASPEAMAFEKFFIVLPINAEKPRGNKKEENYTAGERLYASLEKKAKSEGKEVLTLDQMAEAKAQVDSLREGWFGEVFDRLLRFGTFQPSIVWKEERYELIGKGRLDVWLKEDGLIGDFKTTSEERIDPVSWGETVFRWNYHLQAEVYRRAVMAHGYPFKGFFFIAMRSRPPYTVNVLEMPEVAMEIARKKVDTLLAKLSHAIHSDEWPSYGEISKLVVPRRYLEKAGEAI